MVQVFSEREIPKVFTFTHQLFFQCFGGRGFIAEKTITNEHWILHTAKKKTVRRRRKDLASRYCFPGT